MRPNRRIRLPSRCLPQAISVAPDVVVHDHHVGTCPVVGRPRLGGHELAASVVCCPRRPTWTRRVGDSEPSQSHRSSSTAKLGVGVDTVAVRQPAGRSRFRSWSRRSTAAVRRESDRVQVSLVGESSMFHDDSLVRRGNHDCVAVPPTIHDPQTSVRSSTARGDRRHRCGHAWDFWPLRAVEHRAHQRRGRGRRGVTCVLARVSAVRDRS